MASIAVIGTGYVGLVSGACLADFGNTVTCVDIDEKKIEKLKNGQIPIFESGLSDLVAKNVAAERLSFTTDASLAIQAAEVIFIAVGTPPSDDGSADLRYVEEAARTIGRTIDNYRVVVDKSTVPIGTGRRVKGWIAEELAARAPHLGAPVSPCHCAVSIPFDVVSNPEFLREGSAVYDFMHPDDELGDNGGGDSQSPSPRRSLDRLEIDQPACSMSEETTDVVYDRVRESRLKPPFSAATTSGAAASESAGTSSRVSQIKTLVSISSPTVSVK